MDGDIVRGRDPQPNLVASHFQNGDDDLLIGDNNLFATLPCQYQHEAPPDWVSRACGESWLLTRWPVVIGCIVVFLSPDVKICLLL
jgi:hypothetical protein